MSYRLANITDAHRNGEHVPTDATTAADRAAWVAACDHCARIWTPSGGFIMEERPAMRDANTPNDLDAPRTRGQGGYAARAAVSAKPITENQLAFLTKLLAEKEHAYGDDLVALFAEATDLSALGITSKGASAMIDALLKAPRKPVQAAAKASAGRITEDGMYRMEGLVYKVQRAVHGSGNLYAKLLVIDAEHKTGTFTYAAGAVSRLRAEHRMSLEEAREFGRLYGFCVRCGATLTDESSIAAGIGPVCAGKV